MINQLSGTCYEWNGGGFDVNFLDGSTTAKKNYTPLMPVPDFHSFRPPDAHKQSEKRIPREQIQPFKKFINEILAKYGRFDLCGSYRRERPTVKDLDYVVQCSREDFAYLRDELNHAGVRIFRGRNELMNGVFNGIHCDFFRADPDSYISILIWRTGSARHNIYCATIAKQQGMRIRRNGIEIDGTVIHPKTELEFYEILGVPYIPPNKR